MHINTLNRTAMFLGFLLIAAGPVAGAEPTKSALESDAQGWQDIMPPADLAGWYRVPVPPGGKLGKDQWHVDAARNVLVCDGDGGHDMLLTSKDYADAIFHFEFKYEKIEGKSGYNSGAYVRNSKDGGIWHQAQFGDAKDGFLFGETPVADGKKKFFNLQKEVKENRVKPAGEWNTFEVTARGKTLTLWVNGAVTCQFTNCGAEQGHLGLEGEGYRIEFRNLKVKPLPKTYSKGTVDFGIVVSDLEKSAKFYTECLGLTEVKGFSVTGEMGRKIGLIDNMPTEVRVFMPDDVEKGTRIKVMSFPAAAGKKADQAFIHSTLGIRYMTLFVSSADATLERLAKNGVKPIGETPYTLANGARLITVRDPDGNFIELIGP